MLAVVTNLTNNQYLRQFFMNQINGINFNRYALLAVLTSVFIVGCATPPPTRSNAEIEALKRVRFEDTPDGVRAILKEDVLFATGSSQINVEFDRIFEVIKPTFDKSRYQIIIEGHTDSTGSVALNTKLSQQRADNVRALIITKRIPPARLVAKGLASSKPRKSPEISADDQQLNRRVEFLFAGETKQSIGADFVEQKVENEYELIAKELADAAKKVGSAVVEGAKNLGGKLQGLFGTDASKK